MSFSLDSRFGEVLNLRMDQTFTAAGIAEQLLVEIGTATNGPTKDEIIRMIRHYSGAGVPLLMPIGAVNTGTGKARLYSGDAPLRARVLLNLNRFGIPIGVLKKMFADFDGYLEREFGKSDLIEICGAIVYPNLFLSVPEERSSTPQQCAVVAELDQFTTFARRPLIVLPLSKKFPPIRVTPAPRKRARTGRA